jgi:hypothetical protein
MRRSRKPVWAISPSGVRIPPSPSAVRSITRVIDGVTEMTGLIADPAHLQALLKRIAGLGLTLRSLIGVDTESLETAQPETDLDTTSKGP